MVDGKTLHKNNLTILSCTMHQSTTFPQSENIHRNSVTAYIFLPTSPRLRGTGNQKSRILTHIERDMSRLFIDDDL